MADQDSITLTRAQIEELRTIIHNADSPLGNRLQDVSSRLYFALDGAGWTPAAEVAQPVALPAEASDAMCEAAMEAHYGARRVRACGGARGIDMTVDDNGYNGLQAFRRMWRGALRALTSSPSNAPAESGWQWVPKEPPMEPQCCGGKSNCDVLEYCAARVSAESGWQRVAYEWADMAARAMQGVRNIRDKVYTPEAVLDALDDNLERCESLQASVKASAAPQAVQAGGEGGAS